MHRRTVLSLALAAPFVLRSGRGFATVPIIVHGEWTKTHSGANDMFWNWRRNNNFTIELDVEHATTLRVDFAANFKLKSDRERMSVCAVSIGLRGPASNQSWPGTSDPFVNRPPEIPGCFARVNILPDLKTQHGEHDRHKYAHMSLGTLHAISEPGFYRVEVWGRARSSHYPGTDGEFESPGADGNVSFDFDSFDAYGGTQPQNHLTVELR